MFLFCRRGFDWRLGLSVRIARKERRKITSTTDRHGYSIPWMVLPSPPRPPPRPTMLDESSNFFRAGHDNFIDGSPNVCISLAFSMNARVLLGLVLNPFTAHLYTAVRKRGAFLSLLDAELARQIRTTKISVGASLPRSFTLKTEMVAVSDAAGGSTGTSTGDTSAGASTPQRLVLSVMGGLSQESGSVNLDLCDVAAAISDIKCCGGWKAWEVAAGWLIVIEAQGMILDRTHTPGTAMGTMVCEPRLGLREFIAVRPMMKREERETLVMDYKVLVK